MKKRVGKVIFTTLAVLYIITNLILFIVIFKWFKEQFSNFNFWFIWFMTYIFNGLLTSFVYFSYKQSPKYDDITVPTLIYVMGVFNIVYLVLGFILMFLPNAKFEVCLILEVILTGVYVLFLVLFKNVTGYMQDNNASDKVKNIRTLKMIIDEAKNSVDDQKIIKLLNDLSEDIRFSDPMSSPKMREIEEQLQLIVDDIFTAAIEKNYEVLPSLIDKASRQLRIRNAKCALLK